MRTCMDKAGRAFNGLDMRPAGVMRNVLSKTQTASGSIDALIHDSIDQGLIYPAYQNALCKAVLPAPIPILRSIRKLTDRGGSARGGFLLRFITGNICLGSSRQSYRQSGA